MSAVPRLLADTVHNCRRGSRMQDSTWERNTTQPEDTTVVSLNSDKNIKILGMHCQVADELTWAKSAWRASRGTTEESWEASTSLRRERVCVREPVGPKSAGGSSTCPTSEVVVYENINFNNHSRVLSFIQDLLKFFLHHKQIKPPNSMCFFVVRAGNAYKIRSGLILLASAWRQKWAQSPLST